MDNPIYCDTCNRMFFIKDELEIHNKEKSCINTTWYHCIVCKYSTKFKHNLTKHLKTKKCIRKTEEKRKEEERQEIYTCSRCYKSFRDSYNLNKHLRKKYPCYSTQNVSIINNNMNNTNNTVIINAHNSTAFVKNLNVIDKTIYNNVLGAYSINSPESIERLNDIASTVQYQKPKLINPEEYPSDEEEDIENANHERLKEENSKYVSTLFKKAYFDISKDEMDFMPFFKIPNTKRLKVKYNNTLHEFDTDVLHELVDQFMHKMEIIRKEKNLSIWRIKDSISKAYEDFRFRFKKCIKNYKLEAKRIQ